MLTEWKQTKLEEPIGQLGADEPSRQVKVVFTFKGSALLGIGLFTKWKNGESQWAELCEDQNHFAAMDMVPTHYIILPEIP